MRPSREDDVSNSEESCICIPTDFVCPNCSEKMTVNVGLSTDTAQNAVECPICHEKIRGVGSRSGSWRAVQGYRLVLRLHDSVADVVVKQLRK